MELPVRVIKDVVNWIDARLDQPLRIDEVALRSGYSKRHIQRLFYLHLSVSLGEFIRERRVQRAALDLRETTLSVALISQRYGYTSQQTFTRIFTRRFSMPPGTYRKLNVSGSSNSRSQK